jgi:hypothetical protein
MYVCVLGIPKGKFSKQMKKKKLSYRIIRIKRIFFGVYWCITWTKSLTNLWVNWSRLYINKLRKKCVYSYNQVCRFTGKLVRLDVQVKFRFYIAYFFFRYCLRFSSEFKKRIFLFLFSKRKTSLNVIPGMKSWDRENSTRTESSFELMNKM